MYHRTEIRTLKDREDYPADLGMGFEGPTMDRNWCWVAEKDGEALGGLMGCPMHGALFLMRVAVKGDAPRTTLRALLRTACRVSKKRGCNGFITLTDPTTETGRKLFGIVRNVGGVQWPGALVMLWGRFEGVV
jgi:hypothetical protein